MNAQSKYGTLYYAFYTTFSDLSVVNLNKGVSNGADIRKLISQAQFVGDD